MSEDKEIKKVAYSDPYSTIERYKKGDITIEFVSAKERKKAFAHNNGKGNQPMRKMLPTKRGEKFKKGITDKITSAAKRAIRLAVKKFTK